MKTYLRKSLLLIAAAIVVAGCDAGISGSLDEDGDPGSADFTTFAAIGDSLTAGYADSALYPHGQENSFPAILAQQFALAGGGAFTQPLMPVGATGKMSLTGSADCVLPATCVGTLTNDRLMLTATGDPDSPAAPVTISPTQTTSIDVRVGNGGFNNLGLPGMKIYHLRFPGYGNLDATAIDGGLASPFFARFSSSDATAVMDDALALNPTFFVFWVGNNDLLLYAADGGVGIDRTGNDNIFTYGPENDITDPGFFENGYMGPPFSLPGYAAMVSELTAGGAKGVLINMPDVSKIPYFTAVPYDAIPLDAGDALALNASLAMLNNAQVNGAGLSATETARRQLSYSAGQNPVLIVDENLTPIPTLGPLAQARPATPDDFILLPASAKLGEDNPMAAPPFDKWGVSLPLEDADVLTGVNDVTGLPSDSEFAFVEAARQKYNATIKGVADGDPDLLLFDAAAKLVELNETGILYGSGGVSSTFAQGGFYSLDGIHPTARGNAVIANEIFKVINAGFGAYIPPVDPNQYTTVFYQ